MMNRQSLLHENIRLLGTTRAQRWRAVASHTEHPERPQLPYYHDLTGFVRTVYKAAYIWVEPVEDSLNTHRTVTFRLNLKDWQLRAAGASGRFCASGQDIRTSEQYWASLLVSCYQGTTDADQDPDHRDGENNSIFPSKRDPVTEDPFYDWGGTPETARNLSVFHVEVQRDMGRYAQYDLDHTIAHEIGHAGGPSNDPKADHAELGLMSKEPQTHLNAFLPATLKRFREAVKW